MAYFMLYTHPSPALSHETRLHGHDGRVYRLFKLVPGEVPEAAWWLDRRFKARLALTKQQGVVGDFSACWSHVLGGITATSWVEAERWVRSVLGDEYLGSPGWKATAELPRWFDVPEKEPTSTFDTPKDALAAVVAISMESMEVPT